MISINRINDEIKQLLCIKENTEKQLSYLKKSIPDKCYLRAAKHGRSVQFFMCKYGHNKNGIYIKNRDRRVAENLAQIEYDEKLLRILSDEIESLKRLQKIPPCDPYLHAMNQVTELKRDLIKMPLITDEDFVLNWSSKTYDRPVFKEGAPEFYTKKGLRVRSKSEIIIAELLDGYEIPYLYEKPISFSSGQVVHPDFTIMNVKNRSEIIWEHFGMMDDIEYRNNAFMKIREYEANGYYQGVNMIWTFETVRYPINTKCLSDMIKSLARGRRKAGDE